MARRLRHNEYTVGWVCALPVELAAAQEMLDEEHHDLERDPTDNDKNLYALGSIGGHNVAIVCLPAGRIGNNPAASVSTQMRATFKAIRFGLMVGIGGGVPSAEADIRLGDVVVSQPHEVHGGVVQYDVGKIMPSGFKRTGSLNSPPQVLLSALAKVQANALRERSQLSLYVSKLERIAKFQRVKAGPDVLFEAVYDHVGVHTCDQCSIDRQEVRQPRESGEEEVAVYYGTIASGNQVMRSAAERNLLSAELDGVLCFEMEAAGLMNSFPCLVIRGICDYADSHKNKRWQPYAAATAAAYAKEVLLAIPPAEVAKAPALEKTLGQAALKRHIDGDSTHESNKRARLLHSTGELDELENDEDDTLTSEESEATSSGDSESEISGDGEQNGSESESDDELH
jgi:nucleoside phosphorylase